jgi:hypothetical protein
MTILYPGDPGGDPAATVYSLRALADAIERLSIFAPGAELDGAPILTDWSLSVRPVAALVGNVTGHPVLGSRQVITSELFAIDPKGGWARTMSRFYVLGRHAGSKELN